MSEQLTGEPCRGEHTFLHPPNIFQVPPQSVVLGRKRLLEVQLTQASSLFLN
jgi:hypothetical protein